MKCDTFIKHCVLKIEKCKGSDIDDNIIKRVCVYVFLSVCFLNKNTCCHVYIFYSLIRTFIIVDSKYPFS